MSNDPVSAIRRSESRFTVLNEVHQRLHDMKNLQRASAWPHVDGVARAEKMVWDMIAACQPKDSEPFAGDVSHERQLDRLPPQAMEMLDRDHAILVTSERFGSTIVPLFHAVPRGEAVAQMAVELSETRAKYERLQKDFVAAQEREAERANVAPNNAQGATERPAEPGQPAIGAPSSIGRIDTCEHGKWVTDYCQPCGRVNSV